MRNSHRNVQRFAGSRPVQYKVTLDTPEGLRVVYCHSGEVLVTPDGGCIVINSATVKLVFCGRFDIEEVPEVTV